MIGGLSHPKSRELLGHLAGDTWLTGGDVRGDQYKNTVSADQVAARTTVVPGLSRSRLPIQTAPDPVPITDWLSLWTDNRYR